MILCHHFVVVVDKGGAGEVVVSVEGSAFENVDEDVVVVRWRLLSSRSLVVGSSMKTSSVARIVGP